MSMQRGKLVSGGRLQVPADIRRVLNICDGDAVTMHVVDGELRVRPAKGGLERIQAMLREHIPEGVSLVDELIAERRAEAARE